MDRRPDSKRVDLVYFDAGGGHRSAARALTEAIRMRGLPWELRAVNLQDVLEVLDPCRKIAGVRSEDVYNAMLREGLTLAAGQLKLVYHALIRVSQPIQVRLLARFWAGNRPDMVVSLIPHFNRAMAQALRRAAPEAPFVTLLTDIADTPPHFWVERQSRYVICGSRKAEEQARRLASPAARIWRTSGMVVHPKFYNRAPLDIAAGRARLGLRPELPVALLLFGGAGSARIPKLIECIENSGLRVQLLTMCGRDQQLADRLRNRPTRIPLAVVDYTTEMPFYMRLADVFIGKPGPGCISEALACGLPVIVERNAWTLPQERYNADWVREAGVGETFESSAELPEKLADLLQPGVYRAYKERVAAIENRAVFEMPPILEGILAESGANSSAPAPRRLSIVDKI